MTRVAEFEIHHSAYLGADGTVLQALPDGFDQRQVLEPLYRKMLLTRCFDS